MKSRGKYFKRCFLKYVLVCSLSSLIIQDVSSARIPDCEIRASCSQLRECQETNQVTVAPGSKVTLDCSIMNGGVALGMTWYQVKQRVNANGGLVLQRMNSNSGMNSCRCTRITFTRAVEKVFKTSSPVSIYADKDIYLEFSVKGWPRPLVVWYKPDGKQIINGSEGFYLSEELVGADTLKSILRNPKSQEKLEGDYKCVGENGIHPGWSSKLSNIIELIYKCPWPKNPTIHSSEVFATAFSSINLKCLVEIDAVHCLTDLRWYFNNNLVPLKTGKKYKVQEKKTKTKCKKDFILTIVNVTDADAGKYSCHSLCFFVKTFATIELKVSHQSTDAVHAVLSSS